MTPTATGSAAADSLLLAELVERFANALVRLRPPGGGRIGLAVSGGPDSMAMLVLAHVAIAGEFEVASVDHGLRAEAAAECALVQQACTERGIACAVLKVEVARGNLQAEARRARYAALVAWAKRRSLAGLATAHHADDQAETLLMRLNRGSGVAGLAGVREEAHIGDLALIRPLLRFRRTELAQVVEQAGVAVADDPSNADATFERVRIRQALAEADWLDPLALADSARHLADADEALEHLADLVERENVRRQGRAIKLRPPIHRAIALRVTARLIARFGSPPRGGEVARLIERLERGEGGNLAGVLVTVEGEDWLFRPEPGRHSSSRAGRAGLA